jgi:hypothetical protein
MYDPPVYLWVITIATVTGIGASTCAVLYAGAERAGLGRRRAALLAGAASWFLLLLHHAGLASRKQRAGAQLTSDSVTLTYSGEVALGTGKGRTTGTYSASVKYQIGYVPALVPAVPKPLGNDIDSALRLRPNLDGPDDAYEWIVAGVAALAGAIGEGLRTLDPIIQGCSVVCEVPAPV